MATSPAIDNAQPMARPIVKSTEAFQAKKKDVRQDALRSAPRRANRRVKQGDKEEATKKRQQRRGNKEKSESVWF